MGTFAAILLSAAALGIFWINRPESDPETLWKQARASAESQDWRATAATLTRLAEIQTLTGEQGILLAEAFQRLDRTDEAIEALTAVPLGDPQAARSRLLAGQVELRRRHMPAAEKWLREAIRLDGSLVQARKELIYILGMQLRRGDLDAQFRELAERTTLDADQIFLWCLSRSVRWEPAEAAADLKSFVKADPDDRWSRLALADNLFLLNQLDEAGSVLEPLPAGDPEALARRAEIALARDGRPAAAEILAKGPADNPTLARLRGRLALFDHDAQEAVHQFRIARRANPQDREALNGLATALRLLRRTGEAEKVQAQAEKLDQAGALLQKAATADGPEAVGLWIKLGLAFRDAGLQPQARAWLRLALSQAPESLAARKALLSLESEPTSGNWSAQTDREAR